MKDFELRLDEYTVSAKDACMFTTLKEAQLAFLQQGVYGKVMLDRVFYVGDTFNPLENSESDKNSGGMTFFWICRKDDGTVAYLPLFYADQDYDNFSYEDLQPIKTTSLIYRDHRIYVISVDAKGRISVRFLTMYYRQEQIEILYMLQDIIPKNIVLERLYDTVTDKFICYCWKVVYEVSGDKNKIEEKTALMPVNIFDGDFLIKRGTENLDGEEVLENETAEISGVMYTLKKTKHDKLVLAKQNLQILGKKVTQAQQYKKHNSKIVLSDEQVDTGYKLIPKYDSSAVKNKGATIIVSLKKDGD